MTDPVRTPVGLMLLAAASLLAAAVASQHLGGLYPCEMCMWQRWAHVAALTVGSLALALRSRALGAVAAVSVLVAGALGLFHAGVEQAWWQGPACAATAAGGSTTDVLATILAAPLVRCDTIAWAFLGLSMAAWNALMSVLIGGTTLWLLNRTTRSRA